MIRFLRGFLISALCEVDTCRRIIATHRTFCGRVWANFLTPFLPAELAILYIQKVYEFMYIIMSKMYMRTH